MTKVREWNVYYDEDGNPWAIFLHGHDHDLRTLKSVSCKAEIRGVACCDDIYFAGNLDIGRFWIRDMGAAADDLEHPWYFCDEGDAGAIPVTGARFR